MVGAVELSVAFTNMVDLYLDSSNEDDIRKLALTGDKEGDLKGYAREALRLDPPFKGVYRELAILILLSGTNLCPLGTASADQLVEGLDVQKDGRVFLDIAAAGQNVGHPGNIVFICMLTCDTGASLPRSRDCECS